MLRLLSFLSLFVFSQLANADTQSNQKNNGMQSMVPVVTVVPNYPLKAAKKQIEGYVELIFTVTEIGTVENPRVIDSSSPELFDEEAIKAILKYKFVPTMVEGKPIRQEATQRIEFKMPYGYGKKQAQRSSNQSSDKSPYKITQTTNKAVDHYQHDLIIKDKETFETVKVLNLTPSYKRKGFVVKSDSPQFIFYYYETKKRTAGIEIIDLETLTISQKIQTEKFTRYKNSLSSGFLHAMNDGQHLLMHVGRGSNQKITKIDANTGKVVAEFLIGKKKKQVGISSEGNYLWIQPDKKKRNGEIIVVNTDELTQLNSVLLQGKVEKIYKNNNRIIVIENRTNPKRPMDKLFAIKIINLDDNKVISGYDSTVLPMIHVVAGELHAIGKSTKKPQYLKISKVVDGVFEDISNKSINMDVKSYETIVSKQKRLFVLFGKTSVTRFDLLNPDKSVHVLTPFNIDAGIIDNNITKAYIKAGFGAKVGLIDFATGKFVGSQHTGSKGKKVGNAILNVLAMAATAPTGYAVAPNIKFSKNTLLLSENQKVLFAVNSKTDDVTVFNAEDLSNKRIYPAGKGVIQMLPGGYGRNLPVVVISQRQTSYFDVETGDLISAIKYDYFIDLTDDLELLYRKDKTNFSVSLYDID